MSYRYLGLSTKSIVRALFVLHGVFLGTQSAWGAAKATVPSTSPSDSIQASSATPASSSVSGATSSTSPTGPTAPKSEPTSYPSGAHRLSLGFELGGGINISTAAEQGFTEAHISLGIDVYNSCFKSLTGTCFRFYVLAPVLGAGYYGQSQLPFFELGVGPGIRIVFKRWISLLLEGGFALKFSPIGQHADQRGAGIGAFYQRDPVDSILPVGWFEAGVSFDLGHVVKSNAAKGVHFQIAARIADGPGPFNSPYKTVDLALLAGVRWYFMK